MNIKKYLILFFAFIALTHLSLQGDKINLSQSSGETFWPAIAINENGQIMAIFTEYIGNAAEIFYMISNDGGQSWTGPINSGSKSASIKSPSLDADTSGNFHLAYADGFGSANREIYYRDFVNGSWQEKEQLSFSHANSNWCNISVDGNTVHVAWYQEADRAYIALKSKEIGGLWPTDEENISLDPDNGAMYPDIKGRDGNIYLIFQVHDYVGDDIVGKHIAYNERINGTWYGQTPLGYWSWPDIEVDEYGNVHCLYPNHSYVNYRAKINGAWQGEVAINTETGEASFFDIKYKNNILVATFLQDASRDPKYHSVYYCTKEYNNGWGSWSEPIELDPGTYPDLFKIALDDEGNVHFIWLDEGIGGEYDLFYSKVALSSLDGPYIQLDESSLSFSGIEGQSITSQTFSVRNSGTATLSYDVDSNRDWLTVYPQSGTSNGEWDEIVVYVDSNSLSSGEYTGTINVSSSNAPNSPKVVNVSVRIGSETPSIELDRDSVSFSHKMGTSNPTPRHFKIRNFGQGTLSYQFSADKSWVSVSPQSGTTAGEWDEIAVSVNATSLAVGDHSATITITSPEAENSPQEIQVLLTISTGKLPVIQLNKSSLSFTDKSGEDSPPSQKFKIKNSGAGTLTYQVSANKNWISVTPKTGSSTGEWDEITVSVSSSSLSEGIHTGTITVSSTLASNSPRTIGVTLTKKKPSIQLNKTTFSFTNNKGVAPPSPQKFKIKNSGAGTLSYQVSANKNWISVTPKTGSSTGEWDEISVSVKPGSLSSGTHEGTITVSSSYASNSPQTINVTLKKQKPTLQVDSSSLSYTAIVRENNPESQTFKIRNAGYDTLNYTVASEKSWIKISPRNGSSKREWDTINVSIDISDLWIGDYEGTVTVGTPNGEKSPQYLKIYLKINRPSLPYAPLNVQCQRIDNEGLFVKKYISVVTWQKNSRNADIFNIVKFRVYRKEKGQPDSQFIFIADVNINETFENTEVFSSREERDKYVYAVNEADDQGLESQKTSHL